MRSLLITILISILVPSICLAETGDILFKCTFDEPGATAGAVVTSCGGNPGTMDIAAKIVSGGHDGGKAVSYNYPNTGGEVVNVFRTAPLNRKDITVDYWEKFDVDPSKSTIWNVKSIRPYIGTGGNDYFGALISLWSGQMLYQSPMGESAAKLSTTNKVTSVKLDQYGTDYCSATGANEYVCPHVHMALGWSGGFGTSWHRVTMYVKSPSGIGIADGEIKLWIDQVLIYSISNIPPSSLWSTGWTPTIKNISFHPSDDFFTGGDATWAAMRFPFNHLYDDITVYEGLFPPQYVKAPSNLKVVSKSTN